MPGQPAGLHSCCLAGTDEAFDDDELLKLAQAGRSQTDQDAPQLWPQQQLPTKDLVPPGNQPSEEQVYTGQPMASHEQALPGRNPDPPASAAENAFLELDDDELIELACVNSDPQQDDATVPEQPLQQLTRPSVPDTLTLSTYSSNASTGRNSVCPLKHCNKLLPFAQCCCHTGYIIAWQRNSAML